mgnify:CR=1 FL=1
MTDPVAPDTLFARAKRHLHAQAYSEVQSLVKRLQALYQAQSLAADTLLAQAFNLYSESCWYTDSLDAALGAAQQALVISQSLGPQGQVPLANAYRNLGVIRELSHYPDTALANYQKALHLKQQLHGPLHREVAIVYGDIANVYAGQGNFRSALQYRKKARELREQALGSHAPALAFYYYEEGKLHDRLGAYQQAERCFRHMLDLHRKHYGPQHVKVGEAYNGLGIVSWKQGKLDEALQHYQKALTIMVDSFGVSHPRTSDLYNNIGILYKEQGQYESALRAYQKALAIREDAFGDQHLSVAISHQNLGVVYGEMYNFRAARAAYEEALRIRLSLLGPRHPFVAAIYGNLGAIYDTEGLSERALAYYQQELRILQSHYGEVHPNVGRSYNNIGVAYESLVALKKALRYYQQALEIYLATIGSNHPEVAKTYQNIGVIYDLQGENQKAKQYYQKSLHIFQQRFGPQNPAVALVSGNLGDLQRDMGNYQQALGIYQRALRIRKQIFPNDHPLIADTHLSLAETYLEQERFALTHQHYQAALRILGYDTSRPAELDMVSDLSVLQQALALGQDLYQQRALSDPSRRDSLWQYHRHRLALSEFIQKTYPGTATRQRYAAQAFPLYEEAIANLTQSHRLTLQSRAFTLAEQTKSRQLTEKLQFDASRATFGLPDSLLQREYDLDVDIAYYDKRVFQQRYEADSSATRDSLLQAYESRLFDLRLQRDTLRELLQTQYPAYHRLRYSQEVISLAEVQDSLLGQAHDALVEYFVGDSNLFTWVVLPDTCYVWPTKLDFPLDQWVTDLRCALLAEQDTALRCSASYAPTAYHLYQRLFAPVDSLLPAQASVLIVPDGVLGYLPFETLLTKSPDPGSTYADYPYLLRDHPLSYAYSATLQREMQRKQHPQPPRRNLLAVAPAFEGNPTAQDTALLASRFIDTTDRRNYLTPLRHNVAEADNIAAQLGGDALLGAEATEAAFVQQAGHYRILHLSTHGKANDQAGDYSFLAFHPIEDDSAEVENEWLYNQELYNLQLNADLVVLSACETGIGELQRGEGIISLARGFSYAGAKSLVTSLWNVNDRSTKELMESFYGYLAEGKPKHEALRQAKLDYLDTHPDYLQSPFFWAAFIPIGDMTPVALASRGYGWWWAGLGILLLLLGWLGYRRWRRNSA